MHHALDFLSNIELNFGTSVVILWQVFSLFLMYLNLVSPYQCSSDNTPTAITPRARCSVCGSFDIRCLFSLIFMSLSFIFPKMWLMAVPATGPLPGLRRWSSTARQSNWSIASPARSSDHRVPPIAASVTTVWVSGSYAVCRLGIWDLECRDQAWGIYSLSIHFLGYMYFN